MLSNRKKINLRKTDDYYQLHDFMAVTQPKHIDNRPWHINVDYRTQKWNELVAFLEQLNYEDYCLAKAQTENYKTSLRDLKRIKEELPTSREYIIMVELLARRIIPNFVVHEGREEQTLSLLFSLLGHNFNSNQLSHVSAPHCWSFMLGSLTWLKDAGDVVFEGVDAMKQDLLYEEELIEENIAMECEECAIQSCINQQSELIKSKKLEELISTYFGELQTKKEEYGLKVNRISEEIQGMSNIPYVVENLKSEYEEMIKESQRAEEEKVRQNEEKEIKKGILKERENIERIKGNELKKIEEETAELKKNIGEGRVLEELEKENESKKAESKNLADKVIQSSTFLKEKKEELNQIVGEVKELVRKTEKEVPISKNEMMEKVTFDNVQTSLETLQNNIVKCKGIQKENSETERKLNSEIEKTKKELEELRKIEKGVEEDTCNTENKWKIVVTKRNKIEEEIKKADERMASIDRAGYEKEFQEAKKLEDELNTLNKELQELSVKRGQEEQRLNFIKEKTLEKNSRLIQIYKEYTKVYEEKIQALDGKMKDAKINVFNSFKEIGIQQASYLPKN